ncbi:MAG: peptidylprolyl isomerase [Henriciella sp.]|uniref:peptidylprolyl isomerase n=1 Tax=Henriciella sp. TaxID=1968823 RepID=UPI003C77BBDB
MRWHDARGGIYMMKFGFAALALALSAPTIGQAAHAQEAQTIEGIVAIVNDQPISYSDVRERAALLLLTLGVQSPNQEQVQQITAQALDELIDEKLQIQEATEYEVEVSDEDVAGAVADMARQSGLDRDGLINVLLQAGINPSSLEAQMRAEIAWRRIMGGLYGSRIRISENQIDEQLSQLKTAASKTQYRVGEIFLYAPTEEEREQALAGANTILEQLRAGAPFELAAQRFSSAPTSAAGGDMGWVSLGDLDQPVADAVNAMAAPGLADPIIVEDGIYLINMIGKRDPAETVPIVDLVRLSVDNGSEEDLLAAVAAADNCEDAESVAENDPNLRTSRLDDFRIADLGPEGRSLVENTPVDAATDVFAASGTLAVMYVCSRDETGSALPTREDIEDRLFGRQLQMVSQRALRNLRREATIIQRGS